MPHTLALLGSSRPHGNTRRVLDLVLEGQGAPVIDLAELDIGLYDYRHENAGDDFLALADRLTRAEVIVLATPVYWYSMSAQMKAFVDRLSDLVTIRKDLGRALRGRRLYAVVTSTTVALPVGFEVPFARTCDYLDMEWGGLFHGYFAADGVVSPAVRAGAGAFGRAIFEDTASGEKKPPRGL